MKSKKRSKLDLTTKFDLFQILFQSKVWNNIIKPGSTKPFQFQMLSDVEDDYKFDISKDPSSYNQIYDQNQKRLKFNFWTLLNFSRRLWLVQMGCGILTHSVSILIALCVKGMIDQLTKDFASDSALLRQLFWMFVLGMIRSFLHANYMLTNKLMIATTENVLKVKIKFFDLKNLIFFGGHEFFSFSNLIFFPQKFSI